MGIDRTRNNSGDSVEFGDTSNNHDANSRKPFAMRSHLIQEALAEGEGRFGRIDWARRQTDPPPEETQDMNYSEGAGMAAANDNVVQSHPLLASQQFDGRDPIRDQQIPSADDIEKAANDPKLVLTPELRHRLENVKRQKMSATPTLKPTGAP